MPAHGVVPAWPKRGLHLAAWGRQARVFQHHVTDPERFALQSQQVQARDDDVAPENAGFDSLSLQAGGDGKTEADIFFQIRDKSILINLLSAC